MSAYELVVIGASWGGLKAVELLVSGLPADFPLPIVLAQHRDDDADETLLVKLLSRHTRLRVADAEDKTPLEAGTLLVCPAGYHALVADTSVELSVDAPVQFSRPSIDVLFESAAAAYGARTIGVLLTGANADGAEGIARIAERGGMTIVQDPETAERPEMPRAALARMTPDAVVDLDGISTLLLGACAKVSGS